MEQQPMRTVGIEKITLNIGTGSPGDKMEKAVKLLEKMTGAKAVQTTTKKRIPTWGIRPGLEIGAKVTLRGKKAEALLKRLLMANGNKLKRSKFDTWGNFSFGIQEYLNIPEVQYEANIGIIGLEVAVTLKRPGFAVKRRILRPKSIPAKHQVTKEEAIQFINNTFGTEVSEA